MIPQEAVAAFFARPRKDFRGYKNVEPVYLRALLERMHPSRFWHRLNRQQKVGLVIGARTRRFFFQYDTGTGKTFLAIALADWFRRAGIARNILVLVKRNANKAVWVEQLREHAPDVSYCVLEGTMSERWHKLLTTDANIVIESYAGLFHLCCAKEWVKHKGKKPVRKMVPQVKLVRMVQAIFQGVVMDESTEVKNKSKLPYRICRQLSKSCAVVFPMSGTPFGRDPEDMWAQMFLVDHGETLGETLALFRAAFYKEKVVAGFSEYEFDARKWRLLHDVLANRSLRYTVDQSELPELVPIVRRCTLPEEASAYYQRARQTLIEAKRNYRDMKNIFLRMRQISSGFVGYYDDDLETKARFDFPANPKLDLLLGDLEELPPEHKAIVFYEFTHSALRISAELKRLRIGHVHLWRGTKDHAALFHAFDHDSSTRVLLMQNQFSHGPNLQVARYGLFFESPVAPDVRLQCQRRFERQHSKHRSVFVIDYVCSGTMDDAILQHNRDGSDLLKAIVDGKAQV